MADDRKVIVIREHWTQSAIRDAITVVVGFALIGPGVLVGSAAMQWAGFCVLGFVVYGLASGIREKYSMTIPEAREELDRLERLAKEK